MHALASLDPALHRGLLLLRAHARRDVPDLGLDFTVLTDELGEQRVRTALHLLKNLNQKSFNQTRLIISTF